MWEVASLYAFYSMRKQFCGQGQAKLDVCCLRRKEELHLFCVLLQMQPQRLHAGEQGYALCSLG